METYHTVAGLSRVDAAYLAGIVDGEGTVTLTRKHRNENRQPAVTISNTERSLLEYVREVVGAGKITGKRTANKRHTPSYCFAIYNRQALALLEQIHPYLRTYKRKRSSIILRDYLLVTPRNGRYSEEQRLARARFEGTLLAIKAG